MKIFVPAAAVALAVGASRPAETHGAARCLASPIPRGTYVKTIKKTDVPANAKAIAGMWIWRPGRVPDRNCVYSNTFSQFVNGRPGFQEVHPFTVRSGSRVVFQGGNEPKGYYRVVPRGRFVLLVAIHDHYIRRLALTVHPWRRR